jgi:hypothetical protein
LAVPGEQRLPHETEASRLPGIRADEPFTTP